MSKLKRFVPPWPALKGRPTGTANRHNATLCRHSSAHRSTTLSHGSSSPTHHPVLMASACRTAPRRAGGTVGHDEVEITKGNRESEPTLASIHDRAATRGSRERADQQARGAEHVVLLRFLDWESIEARITEAYNRPPRPFPSSTAAGLFHRPSRPGSPSGCSASEASGVVGPTARWGWPMRLSIRASIVAVGRRSACLTTSSRS
jgi:hypothetical protein